MIINDLININFGFDRERLLEEANQLAGYETFIDPKYNTPISGWQIKKINSSYGLEISNFLKDYFQLKDISPRFFIQPPGVSIMFHRDRETKCSFNFVLSDDPDPISFRHRQVVYKTALLNTSIEHAVLNPKNRRILFKVSVFDKTFEEIKNSLPSKFQFE